MKVNYLRSDEVYRKMQSEEPSKKREIYRYEMMMPFEKKWEYLHVPMKPAYEGGYDVIMASGMLGHLAPEKVDVSQTANIEQLSSENSWNHWKNAVKRSLEAFEDAGLSLPVQEYLFTILLAEPENAYMKLCDGYSGEGGIPGYILSWLQPNQNTIGRLPAALAHETNHNVRFQFIAWRNDITLGEMIVSEGLAENFATTLYGEEMAGPWVTKTDMETLEKIKPILHQNLHVQGMDNLNAYLYGDEMAVLQNFEPVGVPYCAGYACGYHLIKYYLKKTGKSIVEATILPAEEILSAVDEFWEDEYEG